MKPTHHTCSYCGFMWEPGEPGRHSCAFYLKAAVERLEAEQSRLLDENIRLKGLQLELPPRPPAGDGLPRFGLRWNGPQQPLAVPMEDGYWTPWHLANNLVAVGAADQEHAA